MFKHVALCGPQGVGKTTVRDLTLEAMLDKSHAYTRELEEQFDYPPLAVASSFAKHLKNIICAAGVVYDGERLGQLLYDRGERWLKEKTRYRQDLEVLSDALRSMGDNNPVYFQVIEQLANQDNIAFLYDDLRVPEEADMLREAGGIVVRLHRTTGAIQTGNPEHRINSSLDDIRADLWIDMDRVSLAHAAHIITAAATKEVENLGQ